MHLGVIFSLRLLYRITITPRIGLPRTCRHVISCGASWVPYRAFHWRFVSVLFGWLACCSVFPVFVVSELFGFRLLKLVVYYFKH